MRKTVLTLATLTTAFVAGSSALAENIRYPTTGNPALVVSIPGEWVHKPLISGNVLQALVLTSPHHVEVAVLVVPNLGTAEEYAQNISNFSHLTMKNTGPTQLLGFPAFMFDASYSDMAGALINMHVVQAKLDKSHLALIEVRSPEKGPSAQEVAEGKQILANVKLASAKK